MSVVQFQANTEPQNVIYFAFAIRDVKANTFGMPYFQSNKALGMRMFEDLTKDSQSTISKHPEDFQLYELGQYESGSGLLSRYETPQFLANASDYK